MILVSNTQTNACHLIAEDHYDEYVTNWSAGTSEQWLAQALAQGWAESIPDPEQTNE
jgi:hypothetical protein